MKLFVILLFSIYVTMATLAAPLLHFGDQQIRVHSSSEMTAMDMEFRDADASASRAGDMISRCLRAAAFFTTAVPSVPLPLAIIAAVLLLCGILFTLGSALSDLAGRWKLPDRGRAYMSTIVVSAHRSLLTWLALFEQSPNFAMASSG